MLELLQSVGGVVLTEFDGQPEDDVHYIVDCYYLLLYWG